MKIENAAHWNMNSKRMEAQARSGDILVTLGGTEGVLYLANLYHDAGRADRSAQPSALPRDDRRAATYTISG